MALVVGTNSYITVDEADQLITENYLSTDPLRVAWEALATGDKEVLLRRAAAQIDRLPFTGRVADVNQKMAFPRKAVFNDSPEIPEEVKSAQALQSVYYLDDANVTLATTRAELQRAGVTSYKLGDLSETFGSIGSVFDTITSCSSEVLQLLNKWLMGGYRICRFSHCI